MLFRSLLLSSLLFSLTHSLIGIQQLINRQWEECGEMDRRNLFISTDLYPKVRNISFFSHFHPDFPFNPCDLRLSSLKVSPKVQSQRSILMVNSCDKLLVLTFESPDLATPNPTFCFFFTYYLDE